MCDCCKLWTVGCAVLVTAAMAGLNVGLGCGLGTETGVLLTGGCCFFLSESCKGIYRVCHWYFHDILSFQYSPCNKLNIGHLWRDYHRSRNQSDTWVALDSIHVPCWLDQPCVCVCVWGVRCGDDDRLRFVVISFVVVAVAHFRPAKFVAFISCCCCGANNSSNSSYYISPLL